MFFEHIYASVEDVADGYRELTAEEKRKCNSLLIEAAVMIDAIAANAPCEAKRVVSCRMVRRAMDSGTGMPIGVNQGTVSALGYSQTWNVGSGGATGELYIGKAERSLLGISNKIGASNPFAEVIPNA